MTGVPQSTYWMLLITQYETLGMIGLGKLPDPVDGRAERDLQRTRMAIDMLAMLEAKTRGNLAQEEERELQRVLTLLRLNYVSEAQREGAAGAGDSAAGGAAGDARQGAGENASRDAGRDARQETGESAGKEASE
jgi:hypothetical protein